MNSYLFALIVCLLTEGFFRLPPGRKLTGWLADRLTGGDLYQMVKGWSITAARFSFGAIYLLVVFSIIRPSPRLEEPLSVALLVGGLIVFATLLLEGLRHLSEEFIRRR